MIGIVSPSIALSSGSKPDLTPEPNENDLNKQFSAKVAKVFDEISTEFKISSSIGEDGTNSDDRRRKLAALVEIKANCKNTLEELSDLEYESRVCLLDASFCCNLYILDKISDHR
jgi:hypothetical protein